MATTNSNLYKFLLVGIISMTVFVAFTECSYFGLRYGKRYSNDEMLGRLVPRSEGGNRNIQVRSGAKFYSGTRYAGKRGYWKPVAPSDYDEQTQPAAAQAAAAVASNGSPFDCVYIPQVGVRCAGLDEENSYWTKNGNNDITNDDESSLSNIGSNNGEGDLTDNIVNRLSLPSPSSSSSSLSSSSSTGSRTLSGPRFAEST